MGQIFYSGNTILNGLMILLALILLNEKFSVFSLSLNTEINTDQLPFNGWNIGEVHTQSEQIPSNPFDDQFSRIDHRASDFTSRYVSFFEKRKKQLTSYFCFHCLRFSMKIYCKKTPLKS